MGTVVEVSFSNMWQHFNWILNNKEEEAMW